MTEDSNQRPQTKGQRPKITGVAAIVLAAGRSQRMGAFKPLLPFGPHTVIDSCLENLRDGGARSVVVVIGEDARAYALRKHLARAEVLIAVNPDPTSEMSASIAAGVRALPDSTRAVLINPADHAAVPGEVVRALLGEWIGGAKLVKPTWNGRGGHPILVDLVFREELLNLDPEGGLKAFLDGHLDQVKRIAVDSNYIARDMDTWDDYRALHLDVFGISPPELANRDC